MSNRFGSLLMLVALPAAFTACGDCRRPPSPAPQRSPATESSSEEAPVRATGDAARAGPSIPAHNGPAAALTRQAALVHVPSGGALVAWATGGGESPSLMVRTVSADGTLGESRALAHATAHIADVDFAMRGSEAMVVWSTAIRTGAHQVTALRVRPDGTANGDPITVGEFRLGAESPDAGPEALGRMGIPVRIVPSPAGFAIALRGNAARCDGAECPSIRVMEIDASNAIVERGGIEGADPNPGITLIGSEQVTYSLEVNFPHGRIERFGRGPLALLPLEGGEVLAAWLHDGHALAVVRHAVPSMGEVIELLGAGGDVSAHWPTSDITFACIDSMPVVTLAGSAGSIPVRADDPGGSALFAGAIQYAAHENRGEHPEFDISGVTWVRDGLLVARGTRIGIRRCVGTTLMPEAILHW